MSNREDIIWKLCFEKIENKFEHGRISNWTNKEFQLLSDSILEETKLYISISSLKRILGKVEYNFNPQQETKNALAKYIGYSSWDDFVFNSKVENQPAEEIIISQLTQNKKKKQLIIGFIITLLLVLLLFILILNKAQKASFSVEKNKAQAPFLATFNYDISSLGNEKVVINYDDFSYLTNDELSPSKNTLNYSFRIPDVYYVKFISKNKTLKKIPIVAYSEGWYATICNFDNKDKNIFKFIPSNDSYKHDGVMEVMPSQVIKYGFDTTLLYWMKYRNIRDFKLDGKAFIYELKLRNKTKNHGLDCPEIVVSIMGDKNKITAIYRYPGTNGKWATYSFSEKEIHSEDQNMSAFDCNMDDWHVAKIEVKNKTALFWYDSKLIYKVSFNEEIGNISGLMLQTKGPGKFDYIKLYNQNNQLVYVDDFE